MHHCEASAGIVELPIRRDKSLDDFVTQCILKLINFSLGLLGIFRNSEPSYSYQVEIHKSVGNPSSKPPRGSRGEVLLGSRVWRGCHWGEELVLVSACITVSPLITGGQEHTHTHTYQVEEIKQNRVYRIL